MTLFILGTCFGIMLTIGALFLLAQAMGDEPFDVEGRE